jgi:hypothetical protein
MQTTDFYFAANSTCAESLGGSNDYSSHSTAAAAALVPPDHQSTVDALAEIPTIDGITAGRAMAVGALCRIVCAKSTKEHLPDKQLASFFVILHESLIAVIFLNLSSLAKLNV